MKNKITVSLIVPCFNEELNLQKGTLDKIHHYTKNKKEITEVIIVDDGSTDNSKYIIKKEYLNSYSEFRLIESKHMGKAAAIINGIKSAVGDYVVFTDFDLATPIEETNKLIKHAYLGEKIIIGSRNSQRQGAPLLRQMQSKGFSLIRDIFLNLDGITDTQCGFKMFDKKIAMEIINNLLIFKKDTLKDKPSVTAGFDLELLFLARKKGYKIIEIPIEWHHVETKRVDLINDSLESIKDIIKIKLYDLQGKYNQ